MEYEYDFTYLSCQSCTAKIHCDDCAAQIHERLARNVASARIDIAAKRICIDAGGMDEMDLLDLLEDIGVFAG